MINFLNKEIEDNIKVISYLDKVKTEVIYESERSS